MAKLASGSKPTYYIWKTEEKGNEEVEKIKLYWQSLGFRVVTFIEGNQDIQFAETDIDTVTSIVKRYHDQQTWKENTVFSD